MKASAFSRVTVAMALLLINIVLAAIVYAGVFPALMANGTADADLAWKVTGVVFLVGLLSALLVHFGFSASRSGERSVQELADAVRQPVLLLDGMNRYLMINREAEALFGLSRENDSGRAVDPRIAAALDGDSGRTGKLTTTTVIECNDHHFQVTDHPLPTPDAGGGRSRLVILREVDNEMRLKGAIRAINKTMASLSANATTISNSALSLSQGATEQANSLFSITATMDEFSRKIQGGSETAAKSTQLAAGAKEAAERSGNEIANALAAMTDVQDAGVRIARIVKLIDDIAFQTNLLALNAAVEAARAGRQGKGFAVVADEVRNLAGRSAKAAKDTAGMVEDVTERIGNATSFISRLEEMLRNIVQDTIRMADSSATASATSAEQASGIMQVNRELGQMNSVTNSTMSAAEQTATAVETLARQVASLKEKLDEVSATFFDGEEIPEKKSRTGAIRLIDGEADTGGPDPLHSYLAGTDYSLESYRTLNSGTSGNSRELASKTAPSLDWGMEGTGSSGYSDNPDDFTSFLGSGTSSLESFAASLDEVGNTDPEIQTPDGDRVVKPGQTIHLDDAEFGRY